MEQVSLLDDALNRVEANADELWKQQAQDVIHALALSEDQFTTDDVWAMLSNTTAQTHEPRALGALMRRAADKGWIRPTAMYAPTTRPEAHGRPIRIWQSRIVNWRGW